MSSSKRVLKTLTYEEKAAAIQEVENGLKTKSLIAKEFGIPLNTLSTYLKNKETILCNLATSYKRGRKRVREPENPDVDECVYKWFKQTRDKEIPLSGLLIREKAEEFALKLEKHNFKATNGWLNGFKERNGIRFKTKNNSQIDCDLKICDIKKEYGEEFEILPYNLSQLTDETHEVLGVGANIKQQQLPVESRQQGHSPDVKKTGSQSKKVYVDDEFDLFGKMLIKKLRKLPVKEGEEFMYKIDEMFIERYHNNKQS
ncbi:Hypothetical protein CINCED_3A007896 [Cinara cedri]|nr:Hypothetical protein CINCED_3A007896 [Cinara cedri]